MSLNHSMIIYKKFRNDLFESIANMTKVFEGSLLITISGHESFNKFPPSYRRQQNFEDTYMKVIIQNLYRNDYTKYIILRNIIYNYIDKILFELNQKYLKYYYDLILENPEIKNYISLHDSFPFKKHIDTIIENNTNNNIFSIDYLFFNDYKNILRIYYSDSYENYNFTRDAVNNLNFTNIYSELDLINSNKKYILGDDDDQDEKDRLEYIIDLVGMYNIKNDKGNKIDGVAKELINQYFNTKGLFYILMNELSSYNSENKIHDDNIKDIIDKTFNYYCNTQKYDSRKIVNLEEDEKKIIKNIKEDDYKKFDNILEINEEQKKYIQNILKKDKKLESKKIEKNIDNTSLKGELIDMFINQNPSINKEQLLKNKNITRDVLIYFLLKDKLVEMGMKIYKEDIWKQKLLNKKQSRIDLLQKYRSEKKEKLFSEERKKINIQISKNISDNLNFLVDTYSNILKLIKIPQYKNYIALETLFINILGMFDSSEYNNFFQTNNGTLQFWKDIFKTNDIEDCYTIEMNYMFPNMIVEDYNYKKFCLNDDIIYKNYKLCRDEYRKRFIQEPFSDIILTDNYIQKNIINYNVKGFYRGSFDFSKLFTIDENFTLFSDKKILVKKLAENFISNVSSYDVKDIFIQGHYSDIEIPKIKEINKSKILKLYKSNSNVFNNTLIYRLNNFNNRNENKIDGIIIESCLGDIRIFLLNKNKENIGKEGWIISEDTYNKLYSLLIKFNKNDEYKNLKKEIVESKTNLNKNILLSKKIEDIIYDDIKTNLDIDLKNVMEDPEYRFIRSCENNLFSQLSLLEHDLVIYDSKQDDIISDFESDKSKKITTKMNDTNINLWDFCQSAISTKLRPYIYQLIKDVKEILGECIEIMVAGREAANLSVKPYERVVSTDIDTKVFFKIFNKDFLKYYPALQGAIISKFYFEVFHKIFVKLNQYHNDIYPLLLELSDTFEFKALGIEFFTPEENNTFKRRYTIFETISSERLFTSDINLLALEFHIKSTRRMPSILNPNHQRYSHRFIDSTQSYSMLDMPFITPESIEKYIKNDHSFVSRRRYDYNINSYSESCLNTILFRENYKNVNQEDINTIFFLNKEHEKYDKSKMINTNMRPAKTEKDKLTLKGIEQSKCYTNELKNSLLLCNYKNINNINNNSLLISSCNCSLVINFLKDILEFINNNNTNFNTVKKNMRFMFPVYENFKKKKEMLKTSSEFEIKESAFKELEMLGKFDFEELCKQYSEKLEDIYKTDRINNLRYRKYIEKHLNITVKDSLSNDILSKLYKIPDIKNIIELKENDIESDIKYEFEYYKNKVDNIEQNYKKEDDKEQDMDIDIEMDVDDNIEKIITNSLDNDIEMDIKQNIEIIQLNKIFEYKPLVSKKLDYEVFLNIFNNSPENQKPQYSNINQPYWNYTVAQDNLGFRINLSEYSKLSNINKVKFKNEFMQFIFCSLILCLIEKEKADLEKQKEKRYESINKIKQILSNISYGITSESINLISVSQLALFVFIYWIPFLTNKIYILKPMKSQKFFYNQIKIPNIFKNNISFNTKFNQFIKQNEEGEYEYSQFVLARSVTYMLLHLIDEKVADDIIGTIKEDEEEYNMKEIDYKYQSLCNKFTNDEYKNTKLDKSDIEDLKYQNEDE